MAKVKEWPGSKWPGGSYKGKPIGKHGPLPNTKLPQAKKLQKSFNEGYG